MRLYFLITAFLVSFLHAGTPNAAARLTRAYEQEVKEWVESVQNAKDADARMLAWGRRPDAEKAGKRVWAEIRSNLAEGWTLDYAAWILQYAPRILSLKAGQRGEPGAVRIRKAVERFHIKSNRVGYYCVAVTELPDPGILKILERVEKENPDPRVQGAAALGQAILLRKLDQGAEPRIVKKRMEKLRKAIVQKDLNIGNVKLVDVAKREVFRLTNLSIGAKAPNLKGFDIALKQFSLEDYQGKIVVLFFWHTWMPEAERSLNLIKKLHENLQGKNAVVIGVNADHAKVLRKMTADGEVLWRNFSDHKLNLSNKYYINHWPEVLVLDGEGKIKYKGAPGSFLDLTVTALLNE